MIGGSHIEPRQIIIQTINHYNENIPVLAWPAYSPDIRGVNQMVRHDSIRYRFSYPAIRYLKIPQKIIRFDSIRYRSIIDIDIIILYTYFKQPSKFLLTHKCNQNI